MRLSNLPLQNKLRISSAFDGEGTSKLIGQGIIMDYKNPGLPYYPPIGNIILDNLRDLVIDKHSEIGALKIKMPSFMKRYLLNNGEEIEETFGNNFVMLPSPMANYMLLTTHEAELMDYLHRDKISYKSLPLKIFTNKNLLRLIKKPKGVLKCREFEVIMMLSLDKDENAFNKSIEEYSFVSESIFKELNIPFRKCVRDSNKRKNPHLDFDLEYFYMCDEGDNLLLDGLEGRIKALSLSMGYQFHPEINNVSIILPTNKAAVPFIGTYAMGLERILYSMLDSSRDNQGFNMPESIRPFDVSILLFGASSKKLVNKAEEIYSTLKRQGINGLLDNRKGIQRKEKARFSDFLGIPEKIIVSKSGLSVKDRELNRKINFNNVEEIINYCKNVN